MFWRSSLKLTDISDAFLVITRKFVYLKATSEVLGTLLADKDRDFPFFLVVEFVGFTECGRILPRVMLRSFHNISTSVFSLRCNTKSFPETMQLVLLCSETTSCCCTLL